MARSLAKLKVEEIEVGTGAEAVKGQPVSVHYTGWLVDGTKFDSSHDRGEPLQFALGRGQVIKGWDQGVLGMRVGEKARLVVPPSLGYGKRGSPPEIPGDATLDFTVTLNKIL